MKKIELVEEVLKYDLNRTEKQLMRLPIKILEGQLLSYRKYNR